MRNSVFAVSSSGSGRKSWLLVHPASILMNMQTAAAKARMSLKSMSLSPPVGPSVSQVQELKSESASVERESDDDNQFGQEASTLLPVGEPQD